MFQLRSTAEFDAWLDRADGQVRKRVFARLNRAELGNLGDHKMLGSIGEMRIDFGPGYRLYFTMRTGVIVILLCAGEKKSQSRDIERARSLAAEV
jgi:putative addiction module killer protein